MSHVGVPEPAPYVQLQLPKNLRRSDRWQVLRTTATKSQVQLWVNYLAVGKFSWASQAGMLEEFGVDGFCLISFQGVSPRDIVKILVRGVQIGDRVFRFIGHSNSQLRSKTCWLYQGSLEDNEDVLDKVGFFRIIHPAAKRAKRVGLLFSSIANVVTIPEGFREENDEDVERNGFCFTDGCGRLSTAFGKRIARSLTIMDPMTCARYRPSTFQIRFKGYKGMVVEDPGLNERDAEVVKMRPSQRKFRFQSGDSGRMGLAFGVVDYSKPYQYGALNKFSVIILASLQVPSQVFEARQLEYFRRWRRAFQGDPEAALEVLLLAKRPAEVQKLVECDARAAQRALKDALQSELKKMTREPEERKLRIPIQKSRLLFGVADTTGTLQPGECWLEVESEELPSQVLVTRSPCYHPGDIRLLRRATRSVLISRAQSRAQLVERQLEVLRDVVVFPTTGPRPHADEMQGGDLDGDEFFVCWDSQLLPRVEVDAASYAASPAQAQQEATLADLAVHFAHHSFSATAKISEAWLFWAAREKEGARSQKCRRLTDFFSRAVDAVSSGERVTLPADLQIPEGETAEATVWDKLLKRQELWMAEVLQLGFETATLLWDFDGLPLTPLAKLQLQAKAGIPLSAEVRHLRPHERVFAEQVYGIPPSSWPEPNATVDSRILTQGDLSSWSCGGEDTLGHVKTPWQLRKQGDESSGMLLALHTTLCTASRSLLVIKVRERFTMALLLLGFFKPSGAYDKKRRLVAEDISVDGKQRKLWIFGLASNFRRKFEASSDYRLCLCRDRFQLYACKSKEHELTSQAVGGSTFVYIGAEPLEASGKGAKGGKGGKDKVRAPVSEPHTVMSVALQNLDRRGQDFFGGRVNKLRCLAWELYTEPSDRGGAPEKPGQLLWAIYLGKAPPRLELDDPNAFESDLRWLQELYSEPEEQEPVYATSSPVIALEQLSAAAAAGGLGVKVLYKAICQEERTGDVEMMMAKCFETSLAMLLSEGLSEVPGPVMERILELSSVCGARVPQVIGLATQSLQSWLLKNSLSVDAYEHMCRCFCQNLPHHWLLTETLLQLGKLCHGQFGSDSTNAGSSTKALSVALLTQLFVEWASDRVREREYTTKLKKYEEKSGKATSGKGASSDVFRPSVLTGVSVAVALQVEDTCTELEEGRAFTLEANLTPSYRLPILRPKSLDLYKSLLREQQAGDRRAIAMGTISATRPLTAKVAPAQMSKVWDLLSALPDGELQWIMRCVPSFATLELCRKAIACGEDADANPILIALHTSFATRTLQDALSREPLLPHQAFHASKGGQNVKSTGKGVQPNLELNEMQRQAFHAALQRRVCLVQGPPGTGKTKLIAALAGALSKERHSGPVVLLAETNYAVDNLAQAVKAHTSAKMVRLGPTSSPAKEFQLDCQAERESKRAGCGFFEKRKELLTSAEVICSTGVRAASFPKELGEDHPATILDEASQVTTPVLLSALVRRCLRLVLVGDDQQLGPVCGLQQESCKKLQLMLPEGLGPEDSAFAWLLKQGLKAVQLNEQYRMHPKLAEFPSQHFYQGRLVSKVTESQRLPVRGVRLTAGLRGDACRNLLAQHWRSCSGNSDPAGRLKSRRCLQRGCRRHHSLLGAGEGAEAEAMQRRGELSGRVPRQREGPHHFLSRSQWRPRWIFIRRPPPECFAHTCSSWTDCHRICTNSSKGPKLECMGPMARPVSHKFRVRLGDDSSRTRHSI
ncbi:unnamed protein product [Effrenium voratum]|nr:unnamed protein product [Effrenium voratum]